MYSRGARYAFVPMLAVLATAAAGCERSAPPSPPSAATAPPPKPLRVGAAASLTNVLTDLGTTVTPTPVLEFDASPRIAAKLEAGAPYDVVVTADEQWMAWLVSHQQVDEATQRSIASNHLVFVVPTASKVRATSAVDLRNFKRIAVADGHVPLGRYTEQSLRALHVWDEVEERLVRADSARSTLAWVTRGEVDGAVVYASDAVSAGLTPQFTFDDATHVPILYVAAVTARSTEKIRAAGLIDTWRNGRSQAILAAAGFVSVHAP